MNGSREPEPNLRSRWLVPEPRTVSKISALSAHLFTAFGAALGFLALTAAAERRFGLCFFWLGAALLVDGLDGAVARRLRVTQHLPRFDGATLDLVVDFLTYVVVPLFALWRAQPGPSPTLLLACALVVCVASALYFADARMKTADNWFRGFPACWNVITFYLFVFKPPVWATSALLVAGAALMFAPFASVHPMRVARLRRLTLAASLLWLVCAAAMAARRFKPQPLAEAGLVLAGFYFVALSLWRGRIDGDRGAPPR